MHAVEIGQKFGILTVLEIGSSGAGKSRWVNCLCDCGIKHRTDAGRLYRGVTRRCQRCANNPYYSVQESHVRKQFVNYKGGANRRGYDYKLSLDEFREIYLKDCFYCGISPAKGIDRQDNSQGYLLKNCVPCCKYCNLAKRDMSERDFLSWVARIAAKQGFSL